MLVIEMINFPIRVRLANTFTHQGDTDFTLRLHLAARKLSSKPLDLIVCWYLGLEGFGRHGNLGKFFSLDLCRLYWKAHLPHFHRLLSKEE